MITLPNGSLVAIAASYGTLKVMSAVTNANPGVATLEASHGVIVGDIMEMASGWSKLDKKIVRASVVSVNDVTLEGQNTSSVLSYPAGGGVGSVREVLTWSQLTQILKADASGGEQQFLKYQLLEADTERQMPTVKSSSQIVFSVADDITLPGYIVAMAANDDRLQRAVRITLPSGAILYYDAIISCTRTPTLAVNEIMAQQVTLSLLADPVRY